MFKNLKFKKLFKNFLIESEPLLGSMITKASALLPQPQSRRQFFSLKIIFSSTHNPNYKKGCMDEL
jgi:hypothetical protein